MPEETSHLSAEHLKIAAITPYTSIDYPGYFSAVASFKAAPGAAAIVTIRTCNRVNFRLNTCIAVGKNWSLYSNDVKVF